MQSQIKPYFNGIKFNFICHQTSFICMDSTVALYIVFNVILHTNVIYFAGAVGVLQQQAGHSGGGRHAGAGHAPRQPQRPPRAELPLDP